MFKRFDRQYFDLLSVMTMKEFNARYKRAAFGFLWIILNPLLQMVVIGVIFSHFMNIPNYFVYLFSGLLSWQFFSLTITKTVSCFVFDRSLILKSPFPREILPLSIILANFFNYLFSYLLLALSLGLLFAQYVHINILHILAGIIWMLLNTFSFSLLFSSLNVQFRDVAFFVQTLLVLWFYATPILFNFSQLPTTLIPLFAYNPLSLPIILTQLTSSNINYLSPQFVLGNLSLSIIFLVMALWVFIKKSPYFTDWL